MQRSLSYATLLTLIIAKRARRNKTGGKRLINRDALTLKSAMTSIGRFQIESLSFSQMELARTGETLNSHNHFCQYDHRERALMVNNSESLCSDALSRKLFEM